jgi:Uma2 family endonuclease
VGFDIYERLIRATPERTAIRMAYDGKDMEIMVKGPIHDYYANLLDRLITVVGSVLGIRRLALGETTWIRPGIERGIEADHCYVFEPGKIAVVRDLRNRKVNEVAGYPNPDLAVEVDISPPQADRAAIYAALQVPELWTFDGERVAIAQLSGGQYVDTDQSRWIPVTAADATRWLTSEDSSDPDEWEERLRAWAELLR